MKKILLILSIILAISAEELLPQSDKYEDVNSSHQTIITTHSNILDKNDEDCGGGCHR